MKSGLEREKEGAKVKGTQITEIHKGRLRKKEI